jgi:hypothetical protein
MAFTYQNARKLLHGFNRETEKIDAIKYVRECTNDCGLGPAKRFVEEAWTANSSVQFLLNQMMDAAVVADVQDNVVHIPTVVPSLYQDNELFAMNNVFETINGLDSEAKRRRVLQYIIQRFGYEIS